MCRYIIPSILAYIVLKVCLDKRLGLLVFLEPRFDLALDPSYPVRLECLSPRDEVKKGRSYRRPSHGSSVRTSPVNVS